MSSPRGPCLTSTNDGIEELVDGLAVLGDALSKPAFEDVARLGEDSRRGVVPLEDGGVDPAEVECVERPIGRRTHRGGRDAPVPHLSPEPVTDLGRPPGYVILEHDPDPPNR